MSSREAMLERIRAAIAAGAPDHPGTAPVPREYQRAGAARAAPARCTCWRCCWSIG